MKNLKYVIKIFITILAVSLVVGFIILSGCRQAEELVVQTTSVETVEMTTAETTMVTETMVEEVTETTPETTLSPPGPSFVFVSNRGNDSIKTDLYILDIEKDEIIPLNTGLSDVVLPKWSPDGSKILFAVKDVWNLYTINADGTGLTQLTDFRSNNGDWSPDGSKIVFQSDHQNEPKDTPDIYVIDAEGKNKVEILDEPSTADFSPRWLPDGSQIMFISNRTGNYEVFRMGTDGSNIVQITKTDSPIIDIALSPDSSRIAFTYAYAYPQAADLYIIDKDGSLDTLVQLTDNRGKALNDSPSWSLDGKKIYFSSNSNGNYDVWMINNDGSNPVQLTDDEYNDSFPDYWAP